MLMPAAALFLAVPPLHPSVLQADFLSRITAQVASPIFLVLIAAIVFYVYALRRGALGAELGLSFATAGFVSIGMETTGLQTMPEPRLWPLTILAVAHVWLGLYRRNTVQTVVGMLCAFPIGHRSVATIVGTDICVDIEIHAAVITCLIVGTRQQNQTLLTLAAGSIALLSAIAVFPPAESISEVAFGMRIVYAIALLAVSLVLVAVLKLRKFVPSAIVTASCLTIVAARSAWTVVREVQGWQGLLFYAGGFFWLVVAIAVSVLKFARRRTNERLSQS
ncbi:MAG: hypothetical protein GY758_04615 [Fuerstiella sp.]|nr:hypothetical protein [Fuerstiella sp.]MCP4511900.1 hypothetical protein [Fuerstiella sp.]MCP4783874.1 hypothetical protein [Fuerstiella sp.]MCP4857466.1 hypothetical protein [Fuerstiella sp.]